MTAVGGQPGALPAPVPPHPLVHAQLMCRRKKSRCQRLFLWSVQHRSTPLGPDLAPSAHHCFFSSGLASVAAAGAAASAAGAAAASAGAAAGAAASAGAAAGAASAAGAGAATGAGAAAGASSFLPQAVRAMAANRAAMRVVLVMVWVVVGTRLSRQPRPPCQRWLVLWAGAAQV